MNKELIVNPNGTVRQAGADRDLSTQLRETAERSLYAFCVGICGMDQFVPHLHRDLCNWLQHIPFRRKLLLTPRDTFKTSMARCLGIFATIQPKEHNVFFPERWGYNLRILYAAENERRALSRIGWIRRQYQNNELIKALWPELVWPSRTDADSWTLSHFSLPRTEDYPESTFEAAGVDSGSTGGHYDILIKDDLIGLRSRKQPQLMVAAIEWWKTSHSLMNNPELSLDFVFGTRWASEDLYSWIDENERDYDVRMLSCYKSYGPDGSGRELLFPERLTRERLENFKRIYGELYYLNYENRAVGAGTTAFNMDFCGHFALQGDTITFDAGETTKRILEVIEAGNVVPQHDNRPKPVYAMTAQERTELWQTAMENWRRDRISRLERS